MCGALLRVEEMESGNESWPGFMQLPGVRDRSLAVVDCCGRPVGRSVGWEGESEDEREVYLRRTSLRKVSFVWDSFPCHSLHLTVRNSFWDCNCFPSAYSSYSSVNVSFISQSVGLIARAYIALPLLVYRSLVTGRPPSTRWSKS